MPRSGPRPRPRRAHHRRPPGGPGRRPRPRPRRPPRPRRRGRARSGSSRPWSGSRRPTSTSSSRHGPRSRSRSSGCAARARSSTSAGRRSRSPPTRSRPARRPARRGPRPRGPPRRRGDAHPRGDGGWPAAVRLALEAYRIGARRRPREAALDRLQRPEGPIFAYLAEEVVAGARRHARARPARRPLRPVLGAAARGRRRPGPAATLDELAKRALFLQPLPRRAGLVRAARPDPRVHARPPPARAERDPGAPPGQRRVVRGEGLLEAALDVVRRGRGPRGAGPVPVRARRSLVLRGATRQVVEATPRLPTTRGPRRSSGPSARRAWPAASGARRWRRSRGPPAGRPARRGDRLADGRRPRRPRRLRRGPGDLRPGGGRRHAAGRRGAARGVDRVGPRYHRGDVEASRAAAEKAVALAISATTHGRWRRPTRRWASSTS